MTGSSSKGMSSPSHAILHTNPIIRHTQCYKWKEWYSNGPNKEYPEFDIYGPYVGEMETVRRARYGYFHCMLQHCA